MSNTQVAIDAVKKLYEVTEQRNELLEMLESVMYEWQCRNEPNINDCGVYEKALNLIAKAKGE